MKSRGWQQALDALIAARARTAFAWGTHDCCMFAADAVLVQTGSDPAAGLRGGYETAEQAFALVEAHGGLESLVCAALGAAIDPVLAVVGDVVLLPSDGDASSVPALGVCIGGHARAAAPRGLVSVPMSSAVRAWRVQ